jgi:hypothetical protein
MSVMQLTQYNVHFFIAAVAYRTALTLPKVQIPVVQVAEVLLRDIELV